MSKLKICKMIDKSDNFVKDRKDNLPSLPCRTIIVGRTGASKTTLLGNLLLKKEMYLGAWKPENIYIFSPLQNDFKMEKIIETLQIDDMNIITQYDDEILGAICDKITDDYELRVSMKKKPLHSCLILDDLSFGSHLRKSLYNNISRVFCNTSRKMLCSIFITAQYYNHILPVCKNNASAVFFYYASLKQVEGFMDDHNMLRDKKRFRDLFFDNVKEKREWLLVDYSKDSSNMYIDKDFKTIDISKYQK